jgi:hypothetical protein
MGPLSSRRQFAHNPAKFDGARAAFCAIALKIDPAFVETVKHLSDLCLAQALKRRGVPFHLYERHPSRQTRKQGFLRRTGALPIFVNTLEARTRAWNRRKFVAAENFGQSTDEFPLSGRLYRVKGLAKRKSSRREKHHRRTL